MLGQKSIFKKYAHDYKEAATSAVHWYLKMFSIF